MASMDYEKIFRMFLSDVNDPALASLSEEDAKTIMTEYLHKALSSSYLDHLFATSSLDDSSNTFSYTMAYDTSKDESDFVSNAIAKWMVYEWWSNKVNSVVNSAQFFGGSEQKYYSQAAHMEELQNLQDNAYKKARTYIQDRGWIHNSYLGG